MAADKKLKFPVIAINDADTKHLFDNRYGTGQSTLDGVLRATNMLIAGSTVVIAGYGWCGRGLAVRAKGMGATVHGDRGQPAARAGGADGRLHRVLDGGGGAQRRPVHHRDGQQVGDPQGALRGHEGRRDRRATAATSTSRSTSRRWSACRCRKKVARPFVEEYRLKGGKRVFLLGEGRLINLAAAEGHPAMVMDMSFANQALSVEYLVEEGRASSTTTSTSCPKDIDKEVARLKLKSMGIDIDTLTRRAGEVPGDVERGHVGAFPASGRSRTIPITTPRRRDPAGAFV